MCIIVVFFSNNRHIPIAVLNHQSTLYFHNTRNEGSIFNEHLLFAGDINEANVLKKQFREHFRNISRIMDCIGCEKCRLWGKLQVSYVTLIFSKKDIRYMLYFFLRFFNLNLIHGDN